MMSSKNTDQTLINNLFLTNYHFANLFLGLIETAK